MHAENGVKYNQLHYAGGSNRKCHATIEDAHSVTTEQ